MSDINISNAFNYAKDILVEGKSQANKAIKREIKPRLEKIGTLAGNVLSAADKEFTFLAQTGKMMARNIKNITRWALNWNNPQFRDYFNYSWKSPVTKGPLAAKQSKIAKRYWGNSYVKNVRRNYFYADWIEKNDSGLSAKEKREIATIVTHRRIFNDMTDVFLWGTSSLKVFGHAVKEIAEIQRRCVALSQPDSPKVVHVQNDKESYSSFSFAGGCQNHTVSFECQRDESDQHFFVIHNRGAGAEDPEIHGNTLLNWPEGTYARTSVKIAVSLDQLTNPEFLHDLMKAHAQPNMTDCYAAIKKHLLHYPPGQITASNIVVSQDEIAFRAKLATYDALVNQIETLEKSEPKNPALQVLKKTAKGMKPEINALGDRLIQFDPAFHTVQSFGTCSESNLTGPEKAMASPQVRRELKLASINFLAQEVAHSRIIRPRHFRDRKIILEHHKFRQQQLSEKIARNKP